MAIGLVILWTRVRLDGEAPSGRSLPPSAILDLGRVDHPLSRMPLRAEIRNESETELSGIFSMVSCHCLTVSRSPHVIAPRRRAGCEIQFDVPGLAGSFAFYAEFRARSAPEWRFRVYVVGAVSDTLAILPAGTVIEDADDRAQPSVRREFLVWVETGGRRPLGWEGEIRVGPRDGLRSVRLPVTASDVPEVEGRPTRLEVQIPLRELRENPGSRDGPAMLVFRAVEDPSRLVEVALDFRGREVARQIEMQSVAGATRELLEALERK